MDRSGRRRILYVQYTNPAAYPSLEHSATILARRGWQVIFAGAGVAGVECLRFPTTPNIRVHQLAPGAGRQRQWLRYLRFCVWTLGLAFRHRPDWVYLSDSLACPAGLLIRGVTGRRRLIYHEHDLPDAGRPSRAMEIVAWARRVLGRCAALCVAPNAPRLERLVRDTGRASSPTIAVFNCPLKDEVVPLRTDRPRGLAVLYHGSLVPARLPLTILDALARLPDSVTLDVVGYVPAGAPDYLRHLQARAAERGVAHRLHVVGTVPTRQDLFRQAQRCDVGLALMPTTSDDPNLRTMAGASNKPFDYLACGLALLVSELPDWRTLYVEPGYGLACHPEDAESLARALRWFLDHPADTRAMGERGRQRIVTEWHYERQFQPVARYLEETPSPQRRSGDAR